MLKIGDEYAGGLIFMLEEGGQHGWVVAKEDQSTSASWEQARKLCQQYKGGGFEDWLLPRKKDLEVIYQILHRNKLGKFSDNFYWSSTEEDEEEAWFQNFLCDYAFNDSMEKKSNMYVRAIRAF